MTTCPPRAGRLRRVSALALAPLLLAAAVTDDGPIEVIRETVDAVTATVQDDALSYKVKRERVEEQVRAHVDDRVVAQLVLARNWRKLDDGQQKEFVRAFMEHLLLTYWDNLEGATIQEVTVTDDREEKRGDWTVKTKVDLGPGKDPVLMDYRLRRKKVDGEATGPWLIIDIIVEGVSMVSNFRAQFQEVYSNGGAQHLIDAIKKKNATLSARLDEEGGE